MPNHYITILHQSVEKFSKVNKTIKKQLDVTGRAAT